MADVAFSFMRLLRKVRPRCITFLATALVLYGLFYIVLPQINFAIERHNGIAASREYWQKALADKNVLMNLGTPVQLDLNRLNIHLPVTRGGYNVSNHSWKLDSKHAFYLTPGQFPLATNAQPLIYAHEIKGVFLGLNGISLSEPLVITNSAGDKLYFRYVGDNIIYPNQVEQINKLPSHRGITLLTCTNPFFSQRRLYYFSYVGTDPSPTIAMSKQERS